MKHILTLLMLCAVATSTWTTVLVDGSSENTGTSIALSTGGGILHVAYYSSAGLKYARHDTSGWSVHTLDSWTGPHNRGPSLRLDSLGRPCIAYYRGTPWLARWTGSEWQQEEIDADPSGDYVSLAFDSLDSPHVAYNKPVGLFDSRLKYARHDSAGWHPENVDASNSGYDCALGFDQSGQAVVADCASWSNGAAYYRVRTDSGWTRETVLAADASQSSMVLDPAARPCISYYWTGDEDYDLRFAWLEADTWRFEVVDHGLQQTKRGWDNSIAVDGRGFYHISYHAHNERELRCAWGRPGEWTVEVVDQVGMWNLTSSIAVDYGGRAYIAYCDEDEGDALYVAVRDEPIAVAGPRSPGRQASDFRLGVTIVRGVLRLEEGSSPSSSPSLLLDITGRKVLDLKRGANDVSRMPPGVYFVRAVSSERSTTGCHKVVIQR